MWSKSKYMQSSDEKRDLSSNFKTRESTSLIIHVTVTSRITDIWDNSSKEDRCRLRVVTWGQGGALNIQGCIKTEFVTFRATLCSIWCSSAGDSRSATYSCAWLRHLCTHPPSKRSSTPSAALTQARCLWGWPGAQSQEQNSASNSKFILCLQQQSSQANAVKINSYLSLPAVKLSVEGGKKRWNKTHIQFGGEGGMGKEMITRKGVCLVPIIAISSAFTSANSLKKGFWNRSSTFLNLGFSTARIWLHFLLLQILILLFSIQMGGQGGGAGVAVGGES